MANSSLTFHDLEGLLGFLDLNAGKIQAQVKEIGEVQKQFETSFVASRQRFEDLRAALVARVEASGWQQPSWIAARLTEKLPQVKAQQDARLAKLRPDLAALEAKRDEIEARSQDDLQRMQKANPRYDEREEAMKAQQVELQNRLAALAADLKAAGAGLGWLLQSGRIKRIRVEYEKVGVELFGVNQKLTGLRQAWHDIAQKSTEVESALKSEWEQCVAEVARTKAEIADLEGDPEKSYRLVGVTEILTLLEEPQPTGDAEFDRLLAEMLTAHRQVRDYENGIVQVAQLIGSLNGLVEGLGRFRESVKGLKDEQDMHSELADLRLEAPPAVAAFHELWDQLAPVVLDEKAAAQEPAQFASRLRSVIGERLSEAAIGEMFNTLGGELKRATDAQW